MSNAPPSSVGEDSSRRRLARLAASGTGLAFAVIALIIVAIFEWQIVSVKLPVAPGLADLAPATADLYCRDISSIAASLSLWHSICGTIIASCVVIGATCATVLIDHSNFGDRAPAYRVVALSLCTVLAMYALMQFKRADAAGTLAQSAMGARELAKNGAPDDPTATAVTSTATQTTAVFNACAGAWSAWVTSRSDANAIAQGSVENALKSINQDTAKALAQTAAREDEKAQAVARGSDLATAASAKIEVEAESLKTIASALEKSPTTAASGAAIQGAITRIQGEVSATTRALETAADSGGPDAIVLGSESSQKGACDGLSGVRARGFSNAQIFDDGSGRFLSVATGYTSGSALAADLAMARAKYRTGPFSTRAKKTWKVVNCPTT